MDRYKYELNNKKSLLLNKAEICFSNLLFLIKNDHIISEAVMQLTKELHEWPGNLGVVLVDVDDKHHQDKTRLESELREQRDSFVGKLYIYAHKV